MDEFEQITPNLRRDAGGPLLGLTILLVEDSNMASDALRLICLRSGAKLRRADSIAAAWGHLGRCRSDIVIVDLGLPDGSGQGLIADIVSQRNQGPLPIVLGLSGDPDGRDRALGAGAQAFIVKPIADIRTFQSLILSALPTTRQRKAPRHATGMVTCDPLTCREDLSKAVHLLRDPQKTQYVAQFVRGVARSMADPQLESAAISLLDTVSCAIHKHNSIDRLADLMQKRLDALREF